MKMRSSWNWTGLRIAPVAPDRKSLLFAIRLFGLILRIAFDLATSVGDFLGLHRL